MNIPTSQEQKTTDKLSTIGLNEYRMRTEHLLQQTPLNFSFDKNIISHYKKALNYIADKKRALFLAEKMRVDYVFHTVALEGNPMTLPEVKTLIDGITVGGRKVSDAEQVLNINESLSYLLQQVRSNHFQLDKQTACAIQNLVARNEALTWGKFRDSYVSIGGTDYTPPQHELLDSLFEQGRTELLKEEDIVLRAFLTFLWGSLHQFFYDGNKRTSRLLASGILLTHGLPPFMIHSKDQLIYNQTMKEFYDHQEATQALIWLYSYYTEQLQKFGFIKSE